jgi:hypothetical protein
MRHKLTELKPRWLRRYHYRGFRIEHEASDLYAVRFYQRNPSLVHDFKPWVESIGEAMGVVDKLVAGAREASNLSDDRKASSK